MTRRERRMLRARQALMEAIDTRDPLAIAWAAHEANTAHRHAHSQQEAAR